MGFAPHWKSLPNEMSAGLLTGVIKSVRNGADGEHQQDDVDHQHNLLSYHLYGLKTEENPFGIVAVSESGFDRTGHKRIVANLADDNVDLSVFHESPTYGDITDLCFHMRMCLMGLANETGITPSHPEAIGRKVSLPQRSKSRHPR